MIRFICWLRTGHGRRWRFGRRRSWLVVRDGRAVEICPICETVLADRGAADRVTIC